jgi:RNA polymerase sigma-70 factor (sigma-E family)
MDRDDERDFEQYVVARGDALVRFAFLLLGDHGLAEDLVQEVLARMAQRWRTVRAADDLDAYVHRALVNTSVSWRRRARWWREDVVVAVPDVVGGTVPEYDDRVVAALRALPPRQRATVVLRYYGDHSEATTAEILGCSVGTVKSQGAKAFASLRRLLAPDVNDDVLPERLR